MKNIAVDSKAIISFLADQVKFICAIENTGYTVSIILIYTPFAFLITRMIFDYFGAAESKYGLRFCLSQQDFLLLPF